jgi:hypothetical protein
VAITLRRIHSLICDRRVKQIVPGGCRLLIKIGGVVRWRGAEERNTTHHLMSIPAVSRLLEGLTPHAHQFLCAQAIRDTVEVVVDNSSHWDALQQGA